MQFDHILADPAWKYNNRLSGKGRTKFGSGASGKYNTETTKAMAQFPVSSLAAPACMLYMWATGPFLDDAMWLMGQWGFNYTTISHVWIKTLKPQKRNKLIQLLYSFGQLLFMQSQTRRMPGHYTASNAELVLLGWRGSPILPQVKMLPQVFYAPPLEHSRKPDNVHAWIETCCPGQSKVELFARREREGWHTLGDEIDGRDLRNSIPALANTTGCM